MLHLRTQLEHVLFPPMPDKRTSAEDAASRLRDGMTIGIGGWGARRKPMALVQAILASPLTDLTIVSYGGPDVGMLCAAGKVRRVIYGFVSLDAVPLEPKFRRVRETGEPRTIEAWELDEGMLQLGLRAAAWRLPFLPTRSGLGSDVLAVNPWIKTIVSPYADGETLVAMPALPLDAALVHVNRADAAGNAYIDGPDPYFDDLYLAAASLRLVSCERLVTDAGVPTINRMWVDAVIEAPRGAGFTSCEPDYGVDEAALKAYAS
jgi:glutaconate CoA-transferase, subunit A